MGMQISGAQTIAGIKATTLRDALKRLRDNYDAFSARMLAELLNPTNADALVGQLLAEDILQRTGKAGKEFKLTTKGDALALARATPPMKRAHADLLLADVLRIAQEINSDGTSPDYVAELYVFGSYLSDKPTIGDLDVGFNLARREQGMTSDEWCDWSHKFGNAFLPYGSFIDRLYWSRTSVLRKLKRRRARIALHDVKDLDAIGAERRLVFTAGEIATPIRKIVSPPVRDLLD